MLHQDHKCVWYWANGVWCDAVSGGYTRLGAVLGGHMGTLDVARDADPGEVDSAVAEAIGLMLEGVADY